MSTSVPTSQGAARSSNDLSACEREPIHTPGSVQPHGVLLVARLPDLLVVQASANAEVAFATPVDALLGRPLGSLVEMSLVLRPFPTDEVLAARNPVDAIVAGRHYDAILHRHGERLLVELEPVHPNHEVARLAARDVYHALQHALAALRTAETCDELFALAAKEVRALTGFDRVMIYRFEPDDHGVVIAEARRDDLPTYLGLHYPASDIPAPARQLYLRNLLRIIPDTKYEPSPMIPVLDPETRQPLDLGDAVLRSVAPLHLRYLENMGVRASMSISLLERARLWGLVACHHQSPLFVPYETRLACELFGEVLAWQSSLLGERERATARARASGAHVTIVHRMSTQGIMAGLMKGPPDVLDLVRAGGAALWHDGAATTLGKTPPPDQLSRLVTWLRTSRALDGGVYHVDCLARVSPIGPDIKDVASGVLAISFAEESDYVLLWFRPERQTTVSWGGDPRKPPRHARRAPELTPGASYAAWVEQVRLTAEPWRDVDIEQAADLRTAILDIVMRNAAELARLNAELRQAVRARDEFLSMASHELRTPLATLVLQLESLTRLAGGAAPPSLASERVEKSLSMSQRQLKRLEQLVTEMLDVSRLAAGRMELLPEEGVDLRVIVRDVLARFSDKLASIPVEVSFEGDVVGRWDASRLDQVVTNLVSNAIKYGNELPIDIAVRGADDVVTLVVRDRGTGLGPDDQKSLFSRFHRAPSNERRYSGFGLGLWIVKQFVEAHGGTVAVQSNLGRGAAFLVQLPRRAERKRIEPKVG